MDIDGIGLQNRPGDPPGGPFFAEDVPEAAAGTVVFGIVGGAVAVGCSWRCCRTNCDWNHGGGRALLGRMRHQGFVEQAHLAFLMCLLEQQAHNSKSQRGSARRVSPQASPPDSPKKFTVADLMRKRSYSRWFLAQANSLCYKKSKLPAKETINEQ